MEKRLTRTEMLFTLGFLFMLVVAVGAFFVGLKVGADKTEAKYAPEEPAAAAQAVRVTAYEQQDLVSFYHTAYLPFRSFLNEWVVEADRMKAGLTAETSAKLKELSTLAKQRYAEAAKSDVPAISPLLVDSQTNMLKSLKLFEQAAARYVEQSEKSGSQDVIASIGKDAYYRQAIDHALLAQSQYYDAMIKWNASLDPDMPADPLPGDDLDVAAWKEQPLIVKNLLMAKQLADRKLLTGYYPQDLAARVDQFVSTGQASAMKIGRISEVVELLVGTDAVRSGDFLANKARYYENELLPQLPFFISE